MSIFDVQLPWLYGVGDFDHTNWPRLHKIKDPAVLNAVEREIRVQRKEYEQRSTQEMIQREACYGRSNFVCPECGFIRATTVISPITQTPQILQTWRPCAFNCGSSGKKKDIDALGTSLDVHGTYSNNQYWQIIRYFQQTFPDQILPDANLEWLLFRVGGTMTIHSKTRNDTRWERLALIRVVIALMNKSYASFGIDLRVVAQHGETIAALVNSNNTDHPFQELPVFSPENERRVSRKRVRFQDDTASEDTMSVVDDDDFLAEWQWSDEERHLPLIPVQQSREDQLHFATALQELTKSIYQASLEYRLKSSMPYVTSWMSDDDGLDDIFHQLVIAWLSVPGSDEQSLLQVAQTLLNDVAPGATLVRPQGVPPDIHACCVWSIQWLDHDYDEMAPWGQQLEPTPIDGGLWNEIWQ